MTLSGLVSSAGGTTLGVVVSGASLSDATALADALTALLPSLSPVSGLAAALAPSAFHGTGPLSLRG
jgi:hypothetical protein